MITTMHNFQVTTANVTDAISNSSFAGNMLTLFTSIFTKAPTIERIYDLQRVEMEWRHKN